MTVGIRLSKPRIIDAFTTMNIDQQ